MDSSYANDAESFKKFLSDFCSNVIVEAEENDDLPFRLASKQLTPDELEAETLEWSVHYLQKYGCPDSLVSALSRTVLSAVQNIDITELKEDETESKEEGNEETNSDIIAEDKPVILDAYKVYNAVTDFIHETCKQWKENLPELPPLQKLPYSCTYEIKNTRRKMEDRHVSLPDLNGLFKLDGSDPRSFFAVFDGHAGVEAANYAAAHVPVQFVKSCLFPRDPAGALKAAFKSTDEKFIEKATRERLKSGSTGILAYIEKNKLYISWLGDSQALLVRNGQAVKVMNPHKPEREDERFRIQSLGGYVLNMGGIWRVNGMLAVSKAIGDIGQKKFITSDADTSSFELDGTEDYLILACDGLWDVINYDKAIELVYEHVQASKGDLGSVARHLVITAKDMGSSDNITVTVVFFKKDISQPQIPQVFDFSLSESQGNSDFNENAGNDNKGNNSDQSDKGDNSNSTSGSGSGMGASDDVEQSEFIPNSDNDNQMVYESSSSLPQKPVLKRNEPVFIIENKNELPMLKQPLVQSPLKMEVQHSTIVGFRRQFETISVADLKDFSVDSVGSREITQPKIDPNKTGDLKENVVESDSSILSGYLTNYKHSEPFYNKSMFSEKKKHHRRRKKEKDSNESGAETKRSRRHRELSPIVWNFTGSTKPSVNNYKLNYSKQSNLSTPRYSLQSHLHETPISLRSSLPDLTSVDKFKSPKTLPDFRHTDSGAVSSSIDLSNSSMHYIKSESSFPHLPKIKVNKNSHSSSKLTSSWKPKKMAKMISGNIADVPPTPLDNRKVYYDRQV